MRPIRAAVASAALPRRSRPRIAAHDAPTPAPRHDQDDQERDAQRGAPGGERDALDAGLGPEPGERPEHAEQRRRDDRRERAGDEVAIAGHGGPWYRRRSPARSGAGRRASSSRSAVCARSAAAPASQAAAVRRQAKSPNTARQRHALATTLRGPRCSSTAQPHRRGRLEDRPAEHHVREARAEVRRHDPARRPVRRAGARAPRPSSPPGPGSRRTGRPRGWRGTGRGGRRRTGPRRARPRPRSRSRSRPARRASSGASQSLVIDWRSGGGTNEAARDHDVRARRRRPAPIGATVAAATPARRARDRGERRGARRVPVEDAQLHARQHVAQHRRRGCVPCTPAPMSAARGGAGRRRGGAQARIATPEIAAVRSAVIGPASRIAVGTPVAGSLSRSSPWIAGRPSALLVAVAEHPLHAQPVGGAVARRPAGTPASRGRTTPSGRGWTPILGGSSAAAGEPAQGPLGEPEALRRAAASRR